MDKNNDHPSIYYTSNIRRYFRNFKRTSRAEHGKGVNELQNTMENEDVNCYISGFTLKWIRYLFKKDFSMKFFEFIQS